MQTHEFKFYNVVYSQYSGKIQNTRVIVLLCQKALNFKLYC